jgi:DNA ligase-1
MRFADIVEVSGAVSRTASRLEKIALLGDLLARLPHDDIAIAVPLLSGEPRQGRFGIGGAQLTAMRDVPSAAAPTLAIHDVDQTFDRLAQVTGAGSAALRAQLLRQLFERATSAEQDFLLRLLFGELRQGALESVLADAVARASKIPVAQLRRAAMLAGDLTTVAYQALVAGEAGLASFALQPFHPVQPMLADSATDVAEALSAFGAASLEYKLDGARVQVHKDGDDVRIYSRNLRDVTTALPEVVTVVRALPANSIVLDGEALTFHSDGRPRPFQDTMRRFGRTVDVDRLMPELPITPVFFDILYLDGVALVDERLDRRANLLREQVADANVVPRLVTSDTDEARVFAARALSNGHEGVMAKSLDSVYAAGRRGADWLKIKQAHTLDLVILAAEWGSGRRRGTLSNLHLGARDAERGGFVMLGKTFKGLTDEMLAWQTRKFLELEIGRDGHTVHVRPEVVAEIAFNGLQASPQYPGGVALRFARVKRYRADKTAAESDTIATVQSMYRRERSTG